MSGARTWKRLKYSCKLWRTFQEILGPIPDGYDGYFRSRFPKLLIEVYKVMSIYCREDDEIKRYFEI